VAQPESRLVRRIQDLIRKRGGRSFKIHGDSSYQEAGIPDILACYQGRFLGIEVKMPGGRLSRKQERVMQTILDAGGVAIVARSVDDVHRVLDMLDKNSR
jgi:Holliday junction resolvase